MEMMAERPQWVHKISSGAFSDLGPRAPSEVWRMAIRGVAETRTASHFVRCNKKQKQGNMCLRYVLKRSKWMKRVKKVKCVREEQGVTTKGDMRYNFTTRRHPL